MNTFSNSDPVFENMQKFANKFEPWQWNTLCKDDRFVQAFWDKDLEKCDQLAQTILVDYFG
jgi:hypothetical protein